MIKDKKILFYGGLPPQTNNGVTISSQINLKMLSDYYQIDTVIEEDTFNDHEKISFRKVKLIIKALFSIIKKTTHNTYSHFYFAFSASSIGVIKNLLLIFAFRLFSRGKIIIHIHRGDFFTHFYAKKSNRFFSYFIFKSANIILVLSLSQKERLKTVFKGNIEVLHNTIEIENLQRSENKGNIKFIFLSNYLIDKGIIDLLEVFTKLSIKFPDIQLDTYGTFPTEKIKERIYSYANSRISIHDNIQGEEKFNRLSEADCLVLPSWNEGLPLVILEAMSVGTPIIASKIGLIPELLGIDYPYLTIPKDQLSLESVIGNFIEAETHSQLSEELKDKYSEGYSHQIHLQMLKKIFEV